MSRFPFFSRLPLLASLALALTLCACAPRQNGATAHSYVAAGMPDFSIAVAPPLSLAAAGRLSAWVPADVYPKPSGSFDYAVFTDESAGPVMRHAHCILSELPQWTWRWEKETWSLPGALYYSKERIGGKDWTVQMLPVTAAKDWFSALWRANERETPEFWLAKRWSSTPDDAVRVVAEYREPAPLCMRERLVAAANADRNAPLLDGKTLRSGCEQEINAFADRADGVFDLQRFQGAPAELVRNLAKRPDVSPDMGKLVGRAEVIDRSGYYDRP